MEEGADSKMPKSTSEIASIVSKSEDRTELWARISDAWKRLTRRAEENLSKIDLSIPDFRILKTLDRSGPCPMARLSRETMLTQAAITVIVDELEERRLVERIRSDKDRRVINIQITNNGRSLLREALRIHGRLVEQIMSSLTSEELAKLEEMMSKLAPKEEEKLYRVS
jgi:DNA-binding MarR family transcriptional regulator